MAVEPTKVEVLDIQNRVTRLSALRNSHRAAPVPNRPRARRWDRRHTVLDQETLRFYRMGATVAERGKMSMELRCDAILAVVRWPPCRPPPSRGPRPPSQTGPTEPGFVLYLQTGKYTGCAHDPAPHAGRL